MEQRTGHRADGEQSDAEVTETLLDQTNGDDLVLAIVLVLGRLLGARPEIVNIDHAVLVFDLAVDQLAHAETVGVEGRLGNEAVWSREAEDAAEEVVAPSRAKSPVSSATCARRKAHSGSQLDA